MKTLKTVICSLLLTSALLPTLAQAGDWGRGRGDHRERGGGQSEGRGRDRDDRDERGERHESYRGHYYPREWSRGHWEHAEHEGRRGWW